MTNKVEETQVFDLIIQMPSQKIESNIKSH
jgi:hypothetical protein